MLLGARGVQGLVTLFCCVRVLPDGDPNYGMSDRVTQVEGDPGLWEILSQICTKRLQLNGVRAGPPEWIRRSPEQGACVCLTSHTHLC